jgi:glycerophosphoryl diester phosphodiesterase
MIRVSYISDNEESDIRYLKNYQKEDLLIGLNFIEVEEKKTAIEIAEYLKEKDHHDLFIMSDRMAILEDIYEIYSELRLVYEVTKERELINLRELLFSNHLFTCLIPVEYVDQNLIRELHLAGIKIISRVKNDESIYKAILSGVDGVLGDNLKKVEIEADITNLPFLVSHRGYHKEEVENSIKAGLEAYEREADFLEMDLHVTKDGYVVVNHDENLKRTYDKDLVIKDHDYQTLLKAKMRKDEKLFSSQLPLLSEFDEAIPDDFNFLIEVKTETKEEAFIIGKEVNRLKRDFQVMSFYPWTIVPLEAVVRDNINGFLVDYTDKGEIFHQILKMVNKHRLTVNPYYQTDNLNYRKEFMRRMVEYAPWGIKEEQLKVALKEGFDKLNSDYIDKLEGLVKKLVIKDYIEFKRSKASKKLILSDDKGQTLDYQINILFDNTLGLVISNNEIIAAKKSGYAYLYLTHQFQFQDETITMASDLVTIKVI